MLSRVFSLPLRGDLSPALANAAIEALHAHTIFRPSVLLLSIDSQEGCELQAAKLSAAVQTFSKRHSCLAIAFAEDYCLGPAMLVLA